MSSECNTPSVSVEFISLASQDLVRGFGLQGRPKGPDDKVR